MRFRHVLALDVALLVLLAGGVCRAATAGGAEPGKTEDAVRKESAGRLEDQVASPGGFRERDAVVVSVTESDLNRILRGTLRSRGGPVFEGASDNPSKGITGMRYRVSVSEPVLKLGSDGEATVHLSILDGSLDIAKYQHRIGGRLATCENLGVRVDPQTPVDITLAFRLAIEDGSMKILPERVSVPNARKGFRLVKPSRCEHAPLPRWLLWWIGKPRMKHRIDSIGDVLLASIKKSAGRMNGGAGILGKSWTFEGGEDDSRRSEHGPDGARAPGSTGAREGEGGGRSELYVRPGWIDTKDGRLLVSLTAADAPIPAAEGAAAPRPLASGDRSYVAVSQSFLNELSRYAFSRLTTLPRKPGGNFAKLMKSDAIYSLVPGLRGREGRERITLNLTTGAPPTVELRTIGAEEAIATSGTAGALPTNGPESLAGRAMIEIHLSDLAINFWQKVGAGPDARQEPIGSVKVDSGRIGLVPYANPLGGISFTMVQNDWSVSSTGLEFNEDLFAATIQELVFAEVFETGYAPVLKEGLGIGDARLDPSAFRVVDGHLVIEFAGSVLDEAPAKPAAPPAPALPAQTAESGAAAPAIAATEH